MKAFFGIAVFVLMSGITASAAEQYFCSCLKAPRPVTFTGMEGYGDEAIEAVDLNEALEKKQASEIVCTKAVPYVYCKDLNTGKWGSEPSLAVQEESSTKEFEVLCEKRGGSAYFRPHRGCSCPKGSWLSESEARSGKRCENIQRMETK